MAEVIYYYGSQINNDRIPESVKLKSFTVSFQQTLDSQLPPSPLVQSLLLSTNSSYYSIVINGENMVSRVEQPKANSGYVLYKDLHQLFMQGLNLGIPIMETFGVDVSGGILKSRFISVNVFNGNIDINVISSSYVVQAIKHILGNNDLSLGRGIIKQFNTVMYSAILSSVIQIGIVNYVNNILQVTSGIVEKSIYELFDSYSLLSSLGVDYSFRPTSALIRSEIHHVYRLQPQYILRKVAYKVLAGSVKLITYIRVHTAVDIPVDTFTFDVYTQYAIADVSAGSVNISLDHTVFYEVGDSVVITDGVNYYERTITDVTDTYITIDSPISQDIVNARVYKKVETSPAYMLYDEYTTVTTQYILLKGSHASTLTINTPTSSMNVNLDPNTYKEVQITFSAESIVMPETVFNTIVVQFKDVTKSYIVQFVKLKAEPLIRSIKAPAVKRAVLWFNNCLSDEMEVLYNLLRGSSYNIEKQTVNRLIYYAPFNKVSIEDITLYNISTLPSEETFIARSAIVYLSGALYTVLVESVATDNDVVLSVHRQPNRLHVFVVGSRVYVYVPVSWNGTLNRVDLQVYLV